MNKNYFVGEVRYQFYGNTHTISRPYKDFKLLVFQDGTIRFVTKNNYGHRPRGPAVVFTDGTLMYKLNGALHREDGKASFYGYYIHGDEMSLEEFFLKYGAV